MKIRASMRLLSFFFAVVAVAVAVWLRFESLETKPLHSDEAVQAYTLSCLLEGKGYLYDPVEYHGPVLYYVAAWVCRAAGQVSHAELSVWMVRFVPAFFGVAMVVGVALWCRWGRQGSGGIGMGAVVVAMALGALSACAVYYARYFIQETVMVACFWAAVPLVWRMVVGGRGEGEPGGGFWRGVLVAVAAGVLLGVAVASKETWVLMVAAVVVGAVATVFADGAGFSGGGMVRMVRGIVAGLRGRWRWLGIFAGVAGVVAVAFFSSFGENWQGVVDSVKTYWHYAGKASGAGHEKPAGWYVATFFGKFNVGRRVFSIEGVTGVLSVLVPVLLCFRGWWCRGEWRAAVFTWTSGASLLLLYSLIGYKTPWLFLGVLPPLWVASGLGVMTLARRMCGVGCCVAGGVGVSRRGACVAALCMVAGAVVCGALYKNCWWLTRRLAADERNPLAYAHAVDDVKRVTQLAERMAAVEEGFYARVFIAGSEYWPLPWYLRHWTAAHWVGVPPVGREEFLDAPMVITDAVTDAEVASRLRGKYFMDFLGLRPGVLLYLRLREDLWQRIMAQPEGGEVAK